MASKYDDMQSRFNNTQALLEKERLENEHARQIQQVAAKLAYAASGASDKDHDDSKDAQETDGQDKLLSDVVMSIKAESGTMTWVSTRRFRLLKIMRPKEMARCVYQ